MLNYIDGEIELSLSARPAPGISGLDLDRFRWDAHQAHTPLFPGSRNQTTEDVSDVVYDTRKVGTLSPFSFRTQSDLSYLTQRDYLHGRDALHF